jgi:hypothetical protein
VKLNPHITKKCGVKRRSDGEDIEQGSVPP